MTAEEKIDLLCSEHMNGLTTVWAVTKCLEDIYNFLNTCSMEDIIHPKERNELIKHYNAVASEKIVAILEDMDDES